MKQLIVIPCFNTHKYIKDLIYELRNNTDVDILIYDDGSSPALSLNKLKYPNLYLIRNQINHGKGYTLKKAFYYSINKDYTHMLTIDGDMQHNPNEIEKFINIKSKVEFVFGSRKLIKPMPIHRRLSNYITSSIISLLISNKIYDSQCGYRRYKLDCVNIDNINDNGYLFESEIILNSINSKSNITNISIDTIYSDNKSHINNLTDTFKFINIIFKYIFA